MYLQRYHDNHLGPTHALEQVTYGYTLLVTMKQKSVPQAKQGP